MTTLARLDPVTLTIYWNRLQAIVDESTATLLRTAFSRTVTDSWDFSCALFDREGEMIVQGRHGLPAFLGSLALAVRDFLGVYPEDKLEPGDTLITTDPWIGASQINDVFMVTPIFADSRVVGYSACVSHSVDVGGRLLSADSTEIFEEGFRLPILKLIVGGELNSDVARIIRLNVRVPEIVIGDLMAQLAANTVMSRRVAEFLREKALPGLEIIASEVLERSESSMRRAISNIPRGTYHGRVESDGFDSPLTIEAKIDVHDDRVEVDFTGSSPQDEHGINCAWRYIYAELAHAIICVAKPNSPVNGATLRPIIASAPAGTVVNATYPSALGARAMVSMFVQALVFQALAEAVPERVMADAGAPPAVPGFMGVGNNQRPYVEIFRVNGGLGGRVASDGVSALGWPAPVCGTPIEITENEMPILFTRKELAQDSGGAGKYRGGLGHHFEWRSCAQTPITVGVRLDRVLHPAKGFFGGLPGRPAAIELDGRPIHSKKTIKVLPGQSLSIRAAGGGGYGDPRQRERAAVIADLRGGYISSGAEYGSASLDDAHELTA